MNFQKDLKNALDAIYETPYPTQESIVNLCECAYNFLIEVERNKALLAEAVDYYHHDYLIETKTAEFLINSIKKIGE